MNKRKIKMTISFCGENFFGFTAKYGVRTVESELNKALSSVLGERIAISAERGLVHGCSAKEYPVVFETVSDIPVGDIVQQSNLRLGDDLVICGGEEIEPSYVLSKNKFIKEYEYHLINSEMPIARQGLYGHYVQGELDVEMMQAAADYLIGENDFSCFSTREYQDPFRTIFNLTIEHLGDQIIIRISGTGFLMNMVQMIVGELIRVGKGEMLPHEIQDRISLRKPDPDAPEMPASAMILTRLTPVTYYEDVIHNNNMFADYYIVQRNLKVDGNVYVVIMRCEDEVLEKLLHHVVKLAYMDQAKQVYVIDNEKNRIRAGAQIGGYTAAIAKGIDFSEVLVEFELMGTWYSVS